MKWIKLSQKNIVNMEKVTRITMKTHSSPSVNLDTGKPKIEQLWSILIYFDKDDNYYERFFNNENDCVTAFEEIEKQL